MATLAAAQSGVARGTGPAPVSSADGLAMVSELDVRSSVCVFRNVIFKKTAYCFNLRS